MGNETERDYTAASLAAAAGISRAYVSRLCQSGVIPAVKVVGTVWVIRYEDGQRWLAERKAKRATEA